MYFFCFRKGADYLAHVLYLSCFAEDMSVCESCELQVRVCLKQLGNHELGVLYFQLFEHVSDALPNHTVCQESRFEMQRHHVTFAFKLWSKTILSSDAQKQSMCSLKVCSSSMARLPSAQKSCIQQSAGYFWGCFARHTRLFIGSGDVGFSLADTGKEQPYR